MKNKFHHLFSLLLGTLIVTGCDTDVTSTLDIPSDPGTADFSVFVAVGDSLTAGYADGALYRQGQEFSYPAILAESFVAVGGGTLNQPLMPVGATGPLSLTGIGDLGLSDRLVLTGTGTADSLTPTPYMPSQSTSIDTRVGNGGFKNMGVPGAKFYHAAIPGYGALSAAAIGGGTSNPDFARFSSSDAAEMSTDAAGQLPTLFFILWLGNNDVLSYATSGGTGVDQTGNSDVNTYNSNDITDPGFFTSGGSGAATGLPNYATVVAALKGASGKGVLINVADVATIPFFTTVPYNAIPLDAATAAGLQATLGAGYNLALANAEMAMDIDAAEASRRQLNFVEGQNPVLIVDETLTDITGTAGLPAGLEQARPATAEDFILLPALSKIGVDFGGNYGIAVPLVDADVLTGVDAVGFPLSEASTVDAARMSYNATIKGVADADDDLLLFDADAKLRELNDDGILYGTGGITSTFATGGAFSLDGVHPTARGYAVIANEIIKIIDEGFDSNLPRVDPSEYTTVFYQ